MLLVTPHSQLIAGHVVEVAELLCQHGVVPKKTACPQAHDVEPIEQVLDEHFPLLDKIHIFKNRASWLNHLPRKVDLGS